MSEFLLLIPGGLYVQQRHLEKDTFREEHVSCYVSPLYRTRMSKTRVRLAYNEPAQKSVIKLMFCSSIQAYGCLLQLHLN